MRFNFKALSLVIASSVFAVCEENKPNIIFLLSDDQHWNETSVQMHPDYKGSMNSNFQTPNLEKLAEEGMRFSSAYAPAPVCAPTRISIQTGLSPAALNWTKAGRSITASANKKLIPPVIERSIQDQPTFAEILQKNGYATAHYGKWHLDGGGPEQHGYDASDGNIANEASGKYKDPNPTDIFGMTKRAIDFMSLQKNKKKPFYIQLSYLALHSPENASNKNTEKYKELGNYDRERDYQRQALTADLDEGVGVLMSALKEMDLERNTIVIYMSDNGGRSKESYSISGNKGSLGEGGTRAVFIARGPNIPQNSWCHERIVGFDLFPTFCKLADVKDKLPENLEGGDISGLLAGGENKVKRKFEELVFHFPHYQDTTPVSAIYQGDYKLLKYYETGKVELFDLANDLKESNDLSAKKTTKVNELKKKLEEQLKAVNARIPTINTSYDPAKPSQATKGRHRKNR